jgi:hypothetical protein
MFAVFIKRVAPTQCNSPRASAGLSRLEASIAPSALPAPTSVCISSMNRMISPLLAWISDSTALSRSSNSPRYFAPAISAPISSAISSLSLSDSGTSPLTIRAPGPPQSRSCRLRVRRSGPGCSWFGATEPGSCGGFHHHGQSPDRACRPVRPEVRSRAYFLSASKALLGAGAVSSPALADFIDGLIECLCGQPGLGQNLRGLSRRFDRQAINNRSTVTKLSPAFFAASSAV